jgi:tRNA (guanine-N7-)-methyltransferase
VVDWRLIFSVMPLDRDAPQTRRAFFGRRKGHRLRAHHQRLIDTTLPRLALDLANGPPANLQTLFSPMVDNVELEIGFGGGEHLIARALSRSRTGLLGCEPFINGMAKALAAIETNGIPNIRLHLGDALPLLAWLPESSLAAIDLIYPDPWPKRRHWKRRFIQDDTIAAAGRVLQSGGEFRFVTDIADYAAWALIRFVRSRQFIWMAEQARDWRSPWPEFVPTRYEAKATREGRAPCYLVFKRT